MKTLICPHCATPAPLEAARCPTCGGSLIGLATQVQGGSLLAGRYRIVRPLARGGMGAVYLAEDLQLGNTAVAIKEMRVGSLGNTEALNRAIAEFHREATILAQLAHPNLPRVFDQFAHNGIEYLVMEYVPGHTLAEVLRTATAPLTETQVRAWGIQLCKLLAYLHSRTPPLIYRDLKPANIMLRPDGQLVLLDFGIARFYNPEQSGDTAVFGTIGYAPPEQYQGRTDARSDLFSLGVLLHQLATGYNPLERPYRLLPTPRSLRADLSAQFDATIQRATAEDPAARFPDATVFEAALAGKLRVSAPSPIPADYVAPDTRRIKGRRWWLAAASMFMIIMLLGATGVWSSGLLRSTPPLTPTYLNNPTPVNTLLRVPNDMVAIPGGRWFMGDPEAADPREQAFAGEQTADPFLIDRTETTNEQYGACVAVGVCEPPRNLGSATRPNYFGVKLFASYPVINVTWQDARTYCAWRGRRLPTEAEWEKAARGASDQRRYPWGNTWTQSITTTDRLVNSWGGVDDTLSGFSDDTGRVGLRTEGTSPYGVYDMIGNVGEWTSSLDLVGHYDPADGRENPQLGGQRIVRGVPSGNDPELARLTTRFPTEPSTYAANRGFRCAAGSGVLSQVPTPTNQERPIPERMALVPGGVAQIGTTQEQIEGWSREFGWPSAQAELGQTVLTINSFYLDRFEVTNAEYLAFVRATGYQTPTNIFNPKELNIWRGSTFAPELANHPVVNVNWNDARNYCTWVNKRLPTEAEWEWAAKGPTNRLWPWGMRFAGNEMNTKERGLQSTAPVGTFPNGNTPEGIADLGGNVWEWTSTLSLPYPYDVFDGREDPSAEGPRIIRGGSWFDDYRSAHTSGREQLTPRFVNVNVGFRCAQDVNE